MGKFLTTEEFIEKARNFHGNKYDYSKVKYVDYVTKVLIICPIHGEFLQTPQTHSECGCYECGREAMKLKNTLTTENFIEKAQKIHGDKYDYSLSKYVNCRTKLKIVCSIHGEFMQTPMNHLSNHNCPQCGTEVCRLKFVKSKEQFIVDAKKIHGDEYDYNLVDYVNGGTKVKIICREHGEFLQTPNNHIYHSNNCPKCTETKLTTKEFIKKANEIHNNKYNYSLVEYVNCDTKVKIICPEHDVFEQTPASHYKHNCPKCSDKYITTKEFIERAKIIHGDKYDYSKVKYIGSQINVEIMCNKQGHGIFKQTPTVHISQKSGCPKCGNQYLDKDYFIEKANILHNFKYDYSLVEYVDGNTKVKIVCPIHGEFMQPPSRHVFSSGCIKCGIEKSATSNILTTEEFIEKANIVHDFKYDYSKVIYVNHSTKIKIICPIHGEFEQTPHTHINGKSGCKKCTESKGERKIRKFLEKNNILYEKEKMFEGCKNINLLLFDFYLPEQNILIEFDGKQHYEIVEHFGGEKGFKQRQINDEIKNKFARDNNIKLIRIPYFDYDNIEKILDEQIKLN